MEDMVTLMLSDTDLNSTTMNTIGKPGFLTIPGEIRNEIWRMLLTTSYAFKAPTSEGDREAHYELHPVILRVNRQIYDETRGILREGNMWISLCIAMPKEPVCYVDETARLPIVFRSVLSEGLNEITDCCLGMQSRALNIALYTEHSFEEENYDSVIRNALHPPLDSNASQSSTTELLGLSDAYLKEGDAAAAAGLTKAASFYYEQGSQFTFFAGQSYIDKFHPQSNHVYIPHCYASILNAFDIRWAKVLLKLRCYADVQRLTAYVLGRPNQSRATATEKVELVLCCALASLGLAQTARFSQFMRDLFQGTCDLGVFPTGSVWTGFLKARDVFSDKLSMVIKKDAMIKDMNELVVYCKEGEEDSLQHVHVRGSLPNGEEIEFPVAQDWSATASRYQRWCETWARNKSLSDED